MGFKYVVFGTGRMGRCIAWHLVKQKTTDCVCIVDSNELAVKRLADEFVNAKLDHKIIAKNISKNPRQVEIRNIVALGDVCIATCGYDQYVNITEACITERRHMVDLGGNRTTVEAQKLMDAKARDAGVTVIPDCGLAPGMIGILGMYAYQLQLLRGCTDIDVHMRVGGLPKDPGSSAENPLQYELTWSAEGLINEYEIPLDELKNGELAQVAALSNREDIVFQNPWSERPLEAFVTGGGSSNLPFILKGQARNVDYKTIRYRGHHVAVKTLHRLGLFQREQTLFNESHSPRSALVSLLERNLQCKNGDDIVLARAGARGKTSEGRISSLAFEVQCAYDPVTGFTAMAQTTGYSAAVIAEMIVDETIKVRGVVNGEAVVFGDTFISRLRQTGLSVRNVGV